MPYPATAEGGLWVSGMDGWTKPSIVRQDLPPTANKADEMISAR